MIRQPGGASGQLAWAGWPLLHGTSTTLAPAAGGCLDDQKKSRLVQETPNDSGIHSCQLSRRSTATRSPGRSPLARSIASDGCAFRFPICATWLVI